jgi:8-oxo-dGTP pyrophosphatase MutT (NUDIX family)
MAKSAQLIAQAAAIPFQQDIDGSVRVLLIRRKPDGKWGIPKGLVDPGYTHPQAALTEAHEEAGAEGQIVGEPLGEFIYEKFRGTCCVIVYAMQVTRLHSRYLEKDVRERAWFGIDSAVSLVGREPVKPLMRVLKLRLART